MAASRVYVVIDMLAPAGTLPRLVRSTYEAQAVQHAAAQRYTAHIASKDELEQYGIVRGVRVEYAENLRQQQLPLELAHAPPTPPPKPAAELGPTGP